MRRIAITGIGCVTPFGASFEASWTAVKKGRSCISSITKFSAEAMKWKVAGEIKAPDFKKYFTEKELRILDPFVQYAVASSLMAIEDSGVIADNSAGIIIGSSRGGITTIESALIKRIQNPARRVSPFLMPSTTVSSAASYVSQKLGVKGFCLGISNACVSGANAIGEAFRLIKSGYADLVLAGGTEAPICRFCMEGYGASGALSKIGDYSASRPFDITRDGFVLSEGACILVLEDYEKALSRNAKIYAEIIGYGNSADAFHQTKPDSEGEARAIELALKDADLSIDDVDYICSHAASTKLGDKVEADAIKRVFGKKTKKIPVSSVKSMTGHMLAASSAFEIAVTAMSLKEGIITPTINLKQLDPECDLNHITETTKADVKHAISNSFGFGGLNAVLVLRRV
jgi:3-oxoacyl-[acyl-carrier-protein] synthase II